MTSLVALLAALAAALVFAPAADAATVSFVVNQSGDATDTTPGDGHCDTDPAVGDQCTLRAAIEEANADPGTTDTITITFAGAGQAPNPLAALPAITKTTVTIDGGGATTVMFGLAAAGPLLSSTANDTTVKSIAFTGGESGPVLAFSGLRARLDHVTVHDTPGTAVQASGSSAQLTSVVVQRPGGIGILLSGSHGTLTSPTVSGSGATAIVASGGTATVSAPDISSAHGNGIAVSGDTSQVNGGSVHSNSGDGIHVSAQGVVISRVTLFGNGGKPIALDPGANAGIQPPSGLRIGPRQADGSLPLSGTSGGGSIELWSGDPFGPLAPSFLDAFSVGSGQFTYSFAREPQPGATFGLTIAQGGTSEFATVAVPQDTASPDIVRARALSTTDVRVQPSEPLDPSSVQPQDFALSMAGQDRAITAATPAPDGSYVTLTSSGWKAGEAGYVQLTGPGAITDAAGNNNLTPTRLRVAAAPGDFVAPIAGQLVLNPSSICFTRGRHCRRTGMTIKFVTTESGKATVVVQRGDKRIGKRIYGNVDAGLNSLKFDGRLGGRKLRAGRYRLLLYVQDAVGNVTDQPPIALFSVRRVTP